MFSNRFFGIAGHVLFGVAMVVAFAAVFGWVAMLAWNSVIPEVTGLPALSFTQAVAGLVLIRILTGRFTHFRGGHGRHHRRHFRSGGWRRFGRDCRPGAAPHESAALYSEWWESEGEASFQAFVTRHVGEDDRG